MVIAGIVLVVLQVIGVIGAAIAGRNPFEGGFIEAIGYFSVGIIGVILIIVGINTKTKKNVNKQKNIYDEKPENKNDLKIKSDTDNIGIADTSSANKNLQTKPDKPIYGKREFELWLIEKGYKEFTDDGKPSTVYQYSKSINMVVEIELLSSWKELRGNIDLYVMQYDTGGIKERIGNWSNRTVINALKRYKEFLTSH